MEIRIDTDDVLNIEETIVNQIDDLRDNINNLLANVENIINVWSGPDATTYITVYKEKIVNNLNNIESILQTYKDDLDIVAKSYDALDNT